MFRLGLIGGVALLSTLAYAIPHPVSTPWMAFTHARITIQPSEKQICQIQWGLPGQSPHISPFLPCPDLYAYVAQQLKELSNTSAPLQVTIRAPEQFPLNIWVKQGRIRSLRHTAMQDSFKVVKGSIDFKDHPDDFDTSQEHLNQILDFPKALEELRSSLSAKSKKP